MLRVSSGGASSVVAEFEGFGEGVRRAAIRQYITQQLLLYHQVMLCAVWEGLFDLDPLSFSLTFGFGGASSGFHKGGSLGKARRRCQD